MKVLAHDPFWDEAYAKAHGITRAAPDEIFAECDVISLHLPLTPETENFIGAAELAKMKPDAILINTARGGLIDENALLDALEAGRLCGAASMPSPRAAQGSPLVYPGQRGARLPLRRLHGGRVPQHGAHGYCQPHPRSGPVGREDSDEIHTGPRSGHLRQQGNPVQRRGENDHQRGVPLRLPLLQHQLGRAGSRGFLEGHLRHQPQPD